MATCKDCFHYELCKCVGTNKLYPEKSDGCRFMTASGGGGVMYIDPYWLGVLSVLFAEFAAFFLYAIISSMKKKKSK